jgi:hypothetical protein
MDPTKGKKEGWIEGMDRKEWPDQGGGGGGGGGGFDLGFISGRRGPAGRGWICPGLTVQ